MGLGRWLVIRGVRCFGGRFLGRSLKRTVVEVESPALGYLSRESRDVGFFQ